MAQDYFLKIAAVDGESADAKHKGEIEVESFSWGEMVPAGPPPGAGAGAAKVQPQDFHFVKKLDKSSPVLFIGCATGQHFKSAILSGRKAGGGQHDYLKLTMEEVSITSYQLSDTAHGEVLPMDQVSLTFSKLEMSYKEQKPDGSFGAEVKHKFDFAANRKV
jgi:type VI secretion system secreted protein Hcp